MPNIVAYSKWSKGGRGEYPVRFVVLHWPGKGEYSRHLQVKDGKSKEYFIYGNYYQTFDGAYQNMLKAIQENNSTFSDGNVSHIPEGTRGVRVLKSKL